MPPILSTIETFCGFEPQILLHAPFLHPLNVTPHRHLKPVLPYDPGLMSGKHGVLFATQDKTETFGLIAAALQTNPTSLSIVWPNDMGGRSLGKYLGHLGLQPLIESKHHAKIACLTDWSTADQKLLAEWAEAVLPKSVGGTNLMAQAGLFSYRHIDPASEMLSAHIPDDLSGAVADFGCGWGYLSAHILRSEKVTVLHAVDSDARAVSRTKSNIDDPRLQPLWADITQDALPGQLDAVITNPPFHADGVENKALGIAFIEKAAAALKKKGVLYLVANRHLPYEATLSKLFGEHHIVEDKHGFKVIIARKG